MLVQQKSRSNIYATICEKSCAPHIFKDFLTPWHHSWKVKEMFRKLTICFLCSWLTGKRKVWHRRQVEPGWWLRNDLPRGFTWAGLSHSLTNTVITNKWHWNLLWLSLWSIQVVPESYIFCILLPGMRVLHTLRVHVAHLWFFAGGLE